MSTEAIRPVRAPDGPRDAGRGVPVGVIVWSVRLAALGGAAGLLGLWWADTSSVVGPSGWLTGAGRLTGLLAGYLCALVVLLMSRVPWLDATVGPDRLARWHAWLGRWTITLITAHVVLIVEGYALTGRVSPVREAAQVVLHYPDMLKALAALVIFLVTAVVSARAARARLSHETWYHLHLATYAAVLLAFGHQLSTGADFAGDPVAQACWYALYGVVAALVCWFRVLTPVRLSRRHRLRVAEVRSEGPGVVSVLITGRRLGELRVRPGQFMRWRFMVPGMWWTASPYSLSAPVDGRGLRITVKAAGDHSARLARLRARTRVWVEGPYGALTSARARGTGTLLMAGGVGITPLRTLFETIPGDRVLLYWARRPEDLVLRDELEALAAARGARLHLSVSEPAGYRIPLDARTLQALVPDVAGRDCYVCGPPGMAVAAHTALRAAGVPARRIHTESFSL
ncbi:ferric reductase-like transmembrane domain-containing protein [Streptomyces sp. NPDC090023]|uniref:ferredoxin reductase family protein n=1 Tax=unclassified Streptomyces TaxID=2593676 RepID=UPI003821A144